MKFRKKPPSDNHYERALDEVIKKNPDKATFARSLEAAHGNEEKTKALYIKHRAQQFAEIEAQKSEKEEELKQKEEQRKYRLEFERKQEFYREFPIMSKVSEDISDDCYKKHLEGEDMTHIANKLKKNERSYFILMLGALVAVIVLALIMESRQ